MPNINWYSLTVTRSSCKCAPMGFWCMLYENVQSLWNFDANHLSKLMSFRCPKILLYQKKSIFSSTFEMLYRILQTVRILYPHSHTCSQPYASSSGNAYSFTVFSLSESFKLMRWLEFVHRIFIIIIYVQRFTLFVCICCWKWSKNSGD